MNQSATAFAHLLGAEHVVSDEAERRLYAQDVMQWPGAPVPEVVVRPGSTGEVAAAVQRAAQLGLAVAPRGGGMSYTKGYVPERAGTVMLDLARLNQIVEINRRDLYVVLGPAVTWQQLADALKGSGLRPTITGPISGAVSTVGGALSQNLPGSMDGVLGLELVLADGSVVHTGSWAITRAQSPFFRTYGPDLTGLFLGDTGAFAVKTGAVLRLEHAPEGVAFASFAFDRMIDIAAAMAEVAHKGLAAKSFGMDPLKNQTATKVDVAEGARTLVDVARSGKTLVQGIKDAARIAAAGRNALDAVAWSLHLTFEGFDQHTAEAKKAAAQKICVGRGGRDIEPSIPVAMRAKPYSIRGFLGLEGERWVPVHGVFPNSRVDRVIPRVEEFFAQRAAALAAADIRHSFLLSINGPQWLVEPMFYWFDEVTPLHNRHLSPKNVERFRAIPANPAARDMVLKMRTELRDLFFDLGAVSAQVGKFYDLPGALEPGTYALLTRIKDLLDPDRRLNPGNLGWR